MKSAIVFKNDEYHYFDKNGVELKNGDTIAYDDGSTKVLYLSEEGRLGTDATNPLWVESGRAVPCEYGIYPLEESEMAQIAKVEK